VKIHHIQPQRKTVVGTKMVRVFVVGVGMTKFEKPGGKVRNNAISCGKLHAE
jgi:hypothetical protein